MSHATSRSMILVMFEAFTQSNAGPIDKKPARPDEIEPGVI
jgi:hypothetical protein